jgi:hypothetical protein
MIFKMQIAHAFLDRDCYPKTNIKNKLFLFLFLAVLICGVHVFVSEIYMQVLNKSFFLLNVCQ